MQRVRPSWDYYMLGMAMYASQRSHDEQTQHGCIITDQNHRILGVGYNGFPRGLNDDVLPNTRPEKYPWMIHSERNALDNCTVRPTGGIAYVTGKPCFSCLRDLYNNGIIEVVYADRAGWTKDDEEAENWNKLLELTKGRFTIRKVSYV